MSTIKDQILKKIDTFMMVLNEVKNIQKYLFLDEQLQIYLCLKPLRTEDQNFFKSILYR